MIELHKIGSDLRALTNTNSADESQLHVYGEILSSWFTNVESAPKLDTLEFLKNTVSKFSTHLELGRGNSMTRIWESYRGRFPTTGERWDLFDQVLQLSSRFDSCSAKLFPDSVEWIEELRDNIIVIMSEVLSTTDLTVVEDTVGVRELILRNGMVLTLCCRKLSLEYLSLKLWKNGSKRKEHIYFMKFFISSPYVWK